MDSGNSGSLQSSSGGGGDEEYDSRAADVISAFINPLATHIGNISTTQPQPPPLPLQHGKNSTVFDPLSNYFQNPCSSLMNLDMVWSKTIRSDPNINPLLAPSSSSPPQPHVSSQNALNTSQNLQVPFTQVMENSSCGGGGGGLMITPRASLSSSSSDHQAHHVGVRNNPKKRSRASRRAPTTVLTTDTTNFRAMVQEFTGIPSPPPPPSSFSSSPFPRSTRFDFLGTPSTTRFNPPQTNRQLPYIHRPFPQKIQLPLPPIFPSFPSSSMVDSSTNLFSMENPILASLLQSSTTTPTPKTHIENPEILGSKPLGSMQIASGDSHLKRVLLDEFGLSHNHVNSNVSGLSCLVSSDQTTTKNNDSNLASWGNGAGPNGGDQSPVMINRST